MPIYAFEGTRPRISESTYVAPTSVIIGDVSIGERCYIGHYAVLRGDYGSIEIGGGTAVEEGVIIHARPGGKTRIGSGVTLGHGAMIHNATVCEGAVIGMRAVVSDFSTVGQGAIVGEMGLVRSRQEVPANKVAVGVPVQVIGDVGECHELMAKHAKQIYVDLAERYARGGLAEISGFGSTAGSAAPMISVGTIRTPFKKAAGTPVQGALARGAPGEVLIAPAFQEGLTDLEGFSHIVLIYAFHLSDRFELKVKPYLDTQKRGVFATRAPRRPNPIGMTVVRLLEVDGCRLKVGGVDMLDGTPLLDIKPSVPLFDDHCSGRWGWLEPRLKDLSERENIPVADDRFHRKDGE